MDSDFGDVVLIIIGVIALAIISYIWAAFFIAIDGPLFFDKSFAES